MYTDFPKPENKYFKASDFQDQEVVLTYKGYEKIGNEDDPKDSKKPRTWKEKIKYQLGYSYPEFAIDKDTAEQLKDKQGNPFRNKNYDPDFPRGYSIQYIFEEGSLTSGSLPLYNAFCSVRPGVGESIAILRTGSGLDTKWFVKRNAKMPEIQVDQDTKSNDPLDSMEDDFKERF